jgi:hypothetical protein
MVSLSRHAKTIHFKNRLVHVPDFETRSASRGSAIVRPNRRPSDDAAPDIALCSSHRPAVADCPLLCGGFQAYR